MVLLVQFIASNAIWLYVILAVIGIALLRLMNVALKERRRSIFDLERENATARLHRALFYFVLVILAGSSVYYTSNNLVEDLPMPPVTPTATLIVTLPDTPTPPPLLPTPTPTLSPTPRPTLDPSQFNIEGATPTPAVLAGEAGTPPSCLPGASMTRPGNGAVVSGIVQVFGTARIENFQYYKIEFRVPGSSEWSFIERHDLPAGEGPIAAWNSSTVPNGVYEFRLVVVDQTGNFPDPCVVRLTVSN